ncbi:MAG TPA: hypothetical protein VL418_06770 [Devosiaceae bacterium]|nr:hypothetical protein [Devosiaceae bacterium]
MNALLLSVVRLAIIAAPLAATGCTYDYLANSDRIAYSAGDAVHANLEQQTINPSGRAMYVTKGLGQDGVVLPRAGAAAAPTNGGSPAAVGTPIEP